MRDFDRTVISQYSNSATLAQLIINLNTYLDPNVNLQNFYDLIWNVDTAEGYGLDVWGRIVGVGRFIRVPNGRWLGFQEAGSVGTDTWDHGVWYDGGDLTHTITLDDETYRKVIFTKAAANITDGSIPSINQILLNLFPNRGNAYVTDGRNIPHEPFFGFAESFDCVGWNQGIWADLYIGAFPRNMTMVYVFEFALDETEVAIVLKSGVLPKPVGVKATASYIGSGPDVLMTDDGGLVITADDGTVLTTC